MTQTQDAVAALSADGAEIDRMVADLDPEQWELPTPAPGWTVAHQIAHLAATFRLAGTAAGDPETFRAAAGAIGGDFNGAVRAALQPFLAERRDVLLARWQDERAAALKALSDVPEGQLVPWLVRPIPAPVLACAGMMELFGHGQDIADTLGVVRERTDRIRYLVDFAVRVWDFGYQARQLPTPEREFRFEITAPSGALWTFGPEDAEDRVTAPAEDFCLLVTRRRHRDDLAVTAVGDVAEHWLDIAQAYRGPAGEGRTPGQFAGR